MIIINFALRYILSTDSINVDDLMTYLNKYFNNTVNIDNKLVEILVPIILKQINKLDTKQLINLPVENVISTICSSIKIKTIVNNEIAELIINSIDDQSLTDEIIHHFFRLKVNNIEHYLTNLLKDNNEIINYLNKIKDFSETIGDTIDSEDLIKQLDKTYLLNIIIDSINHILPDSEIEKIINKYIKYKLTDNLLLTILREILASNLFLDTFISHITNKKQITLIDTNHLLYNLCVNDQDILNQVKVALHKLYFKLDSIEANQLNKINDKIGDEYFLQSIVDSINRDAPFVIFDNKLLTPKNSEKDVKNTHALLINNYIQSLINVKKFKSNFYRPKTENLMQKLQLKGLAFGSIVNNVYLIDDITGLNKKQVIEIIKKEKGNVKVYFITYPNVLTRLAKKSK